MQWPIHIIHDQQVLRLVAERIVVNETSKRYRVIARNRSLVVQNNRPLLLRHGLKHRRIDWKLVDGSLQNTKLLELICKKIEESMK